MIRVVSRSTLTTVCLGSILCLFLSMSLSQGEDVNHARRDDVVQQPKPCCLPFKFTAVLAPLSTFSAQQKNSVHVDAFSWCISKDIAHYVRLSSSAVTWTIVYQVMRVYRHWEARFQVQDTSTFSVNGIEETLSRVITDYNNKVRYMVQGDACRSAPISSGMLEPCMPENSEYLGKSYLGAFENQADFDSWYFRRTDQNRNIEMTIIVTSDKCVPIMEHVTGTMGQSSTDTLVLFTNLTQEFDESVFQIPASCLKSGPM